MRTLCFLLPAFVTLMLPCVAQSTVPKLAGAWSGTLAAGEQQLHLDLHLAPNTAGGYNCTLDSVDQHAMGLPCTVTSAVPSQLTFDVPVVGGHWSGKLVDNSLTGSWSQNGQALPLTFVRFATTANTGTATASGKVNPSLEGIWYGKLPGSPVDLQLHFTKGADGSFTCTADAPFQHASGIACRLTSTSEPIAFTVPSVHAGFSGALSADGNTLTGTFTQGMALPLILTRQQKPVPVTAAPQPDAAMPPVPLAELPAVLNRDIAAALTSGPLASANHGGITLGILQHGQRRILTYGVAKEDSVYEIGSVTKTMTATLLAQLVQQGKVTLDEPVRTLLPAGAVAKPASGPEITLLSLSTQHSGLPRMPNNFAPRDPANPYADYDAKRMYAYMQQAGVSLDPAAPFGYSNLGVGLLGQALSERAGKPYPALLHDQLLTPLGMANTGIKLTPSMQSRMLPGHGDDGKEAHAWDLDAFAGAGGVRSDAADMLTYLAAELHPDQLPASAAGSADGKTLSAALQLTQQVQAEAMPGVHIALNWFHTDSSGTYWHNGATGGYTAYAAFNPARDEAVVVLANFSAETPLTDHIGQHVMQRLAGKPAVHLAAAE